MNTPRRCTSSEIARMREQLQALNGEPGVAALLVLLSGLEQLLEAGTIALRVVDTHGGYLAALHFALVELCAMLKSLRAALCGCERTMRKIRLFRLAPTEASESLLSLTSTYLGTIDDLLWYLPVRHRRTRAEA